MANVTFNYNSFKSALVHECGHAAAVMYMVQNPLGMNHSELFAGCGEVLSSKITLNVTGLTPEMEKNWAGNHAYSYKRVDPFTPYQEAFEIVAGMVWQFAYHTGGMIGCLEFGVEFLKELHEDHTALGCWRSDKNSLYEILINLGCDPLGHYTDSNSVFGAIIALAEEAYDLFCYANNGSYSFVDSVEQRLQYIDGVYSVTFDPASEQIIEVIEEEPGIYETIFDEETGEYVETKLF